jgi:TonB-linked SusC/RagA family outer membrane protein
MNSFLQLFKLKHISLIILIGVALSAKAQNTEKISGTVADENNKSLSGVSVVVKGTTRAAATNDNGFYSITAAKGAVLVFSSTGFQTQEITVGNSNEVNVRLKVDTVVLEEVQVGYQRLRKSDLTGAISSVKAKELNLSTPTLSQALVGKVAGVQVAQVSGAPYSGTKIRIRGTGSINASSEPLYVIDGYAVSGNVSQGPGNSQNSVNGYNPGTSGNDIFINPDDIESIEILKDAASAAIYGSRASAGVILITTKRGKQGKGKFEYNYQLGSQQLEHKVKLLNAEDFTDLFVDGRNANYKDILIAKGYTWNDSYYSDDNATRIAKAGQTATGCSVCIIKDLYNFQTQQIIKPKYNTDWQDVLYSNALMQRHNLSFSGGTNSTRYLISGGYLDQPGILNSTFQKRINFRTNIDADISKKLKVSSSVFVTNTNNREVQEGRFDHGPILGALVYMPIFPAFDDNNQPITADKGAAARTDGFSYAFQGIENPLVLAQRVKITRKATRATYNANATYEILKDLSAKINVGGQTYFEKYEYYFPTNMSNGINPPGSPQSIAAANASVQDYSSQDLLGEFTLNYKKQFNKHNLDVLGGYTAQKTLVSIAAFGAKNFSNDLVPDFTGGGSAAGDFYRLPGSGKSTTTLVSWLGRVVYGYDRKYFVTGSFRADASSRFGPENRWGKFGSVSAGWTISNESFYNNWLGKNSILKLRASWGLTGNNNIGNYQYEQDLTGTGGVPLGTTVYNGIWAGGVKDAKLGWESTAQYNFGIDATALNGRLSVILNYYINKSYNLLYNRNISAFSGSSTVLTNLRNSNIRNNGIDLQLDIKVIESTNFNLNFSGNIAANKNKVISLGGASAIQVNGAERSYITHITREGSPVGSFYGLKVAGMIREEDMANVNADLAVYKANGNKFPAGYKPSFPISTYSSTPLNPGDLYFEDKNGDGIITDADKDIIGNAFPDYTFGFGVNANYKIIDFSASFNGSQGNKVLDGQDYYIRNMEGSGNNYEVVKYRYRNESQPGNGHEYRASRGSTQSNSTRLSDYYLQDGSFLRCTNITLGANLSSIHGIKKAFNGLRIYISVDNLFTITNYLGYNPEVDYNNGTNLTPGVAYGKYPLIRSYNAGIQIQF